MNGLAEAWPWLVAMGVLVLLSAFFSGSEAALFSLTPRTRRRLARGGAGGRISHRLLQDPERLLSAILFWNLLINMIYFAIATIVASRLESDDLGNSPAFAFTALTLLTIIFFSEMLPKSVAVLIPVRLSMILGPPMAVAVRIVSPILPIVESTNQLVRRIIWPTFEPEPEIALRDIERAIDLGTGDAVLRQRDRIAFHGLVEMAEVRAAEIMRPRAKLLMCPSPISLDAISKSVPGGYLMVTDPEQKTIIATVGVQNMRPSQLDDIQSAAEDVIYVPWSSLISQVWERLDDADVSVAVVVNEFGEIVGATTVDDILRRVLAPRRGNENLSGSTSIEELDDGSFRVLGSVSLRALAKRLEIDLPEEAVATVGGYIQRQRERFPRVGDQVMLERFELTVVAQEDEETWIEVRPTEEESDDREGPS